MAGIPTSDQLVRQTPNLRTGVNAVDYTPLAKADRALGEATTNVGKGIIALGAGIEQKQQADAKFQYTIARSKFLQDTIELENNLENAEDYTTIPKSFQDGMAKIKQDALSKVKDGRFQEQLDSEIGLQTQRSAVDVDRLFRKKDGDNDRSILLSTIDKNLNALASTNNEDLRNEIIFSNDQGIEDLVQKGSIDKQSAEKVKNEFYNNYATNRLSAMPEVNQIKALGAKRGKNGEVLFPDKTGTFVDYLSVDKKLQFFNRAESQIEATVKQDISQEVQDIEQATQLGLVVPKENITNLAHRAKSVGMDNLSNSLNKYAKVQDDAQIFATKPITEQKALISQVGNNIEQGNIGDVDKYAAFKKVFDNKIKFLKDDPYTYYTSHNVIDAQEPINITDPNSIAQNLQSRRIQAQKVKQLEGNSYNLPLFTKDEIGQLKDIYEKQSPTQTANIISNIGNQLTREEKTNLAQQLASGDNKVDILASAMALPQKQAQDLLVGNSIKGDVQEKSVTDQIASKIKGYVLNAETSDSLKRSIFATYKKLAFDVGNTDATVDDDILNKSIEQVIGKQEQISIKGNKSEIFSFRGDDGRFVSDNTLEDIFMSVDNNILKQLNGSLPIMPSGDILEAKDILTQTRMVNKGDGVYAPYIDDLGFLINKDGSIYTIDARKVQQITGGVRTKEYRKRYLNKDGILID